MPPASRTAKPLHSVIDSTGLKLSGQGEWKVRKPGWYKARAWRKVDIAFEANKGQIWVALIAHQGVGDREVLADLLDQIPADTPINIIGGDGAYDIKPCHAEIAARSAQPSIPPRDGAMPWSESTPSAAWRNEAIVVIEKNRRREWEVASGYHQRSLVDTLMHRLKMLTGYRPWARESGSRATEVTRRVGVLNRIVALARTQSIRIA